MADPMPFIHEAFIWRVPVNATVIIGTTVALAGMTSDTEFSWNYGRVTDLRPQPQELHLLVDLFLNQPELLSGYFVPVEVHGFAHNNNALYWIGPSGQSQPYFGPVEEFFINGLAATHNDLALRADSDFFFGDSMKDRNGFALVLSLMFLLILTLFALILL